MNSAFRFLVKSQLNRYSNKTLESFLPHCAFRQPVESARKLRRAESKAPVCLSGSTFLVLFSSIHLCYYQALARTQRLDRYGTQGDLTPIFPIFSDSLVKEAICILPCRLFVLVEKCLGLKCFLNCFVLKFSFSEKATKF